jgi:NAD(P) transhydrogenase subunit beta
MSVSVASILYLVSGVLFILALRGLSHPTTSRQGNLFGMVGMGLAVLTTLVLEPPDGPGAFLLVVLGLAVGGGAGAYIARTVPMTAMPQLVAAFHSLVGLAAVLVAAAALYAPQAFGIGTVGTIKGASLFEMALGVAIGAITFTGSVIAFLKLDARMSGKPILLPQRHALNIALGLGLLLLIALFIGGESRLVFWLIVLVSFVLGVTLIIPIGGADMPVVVSMLNSYSGWAAAGIGFTLGNLALIITGALVGSSGAILSYIMCRAMNRSFISVILGGFGGETAAAGGAAETRPVKQGSADDAAFIMKNAEKVIIVPGYGMAVAQAQHALREMADQLKEEGVEVKYAIHPVAGRMPGHMNVLLAEANVPYDEVFELEDINGEFAQADVAFVIGANDVTNPAAKTDKASPIYGMPVLDVEKAKTVLFIKRGMGSGYAGVENELFFRDNTMMLFGDAKKVVDQVLKNLD